MVEIRHVNVFIGSFLKTKHGFSCINWCHAGNTASCVRRQVDDFATESQGPKTEA